MTKPNSMMIDDTKYIREDSILQAKPQDDKVVLIRTRYAGVHVGEIALRSGTEVTLTNATRVWRWKGANTLSELSQKGGDTGYTRISETVPTISLTEVLEVIPCSVEAAKNLRTPRWPG